MLILDCIAISGLKYYLSLFQVIGVYFIFILEVPKLNEDILANDMSLKKIRYLLLYIECC